MSDLPIEVVDGDSIGSYPASGNPSREPVEDIYLFCSWCGGLFHSHFMARVELTQGEADALADTYPAGPARAQVIATVIKQTRRAMACPDCVGTIHV